MDIFTVIDEHGNFVFSGTFEECKKWCKDNDKEGYRIWR